MPPKDSKRARVMERSKKLGHCICDPRKSCPCNLLIEKDVCLCAGERLPSSQPSEGRRAPASSPALTKLVKNAGCASKIPAAELAKILARLPPVSDPRLLVGPATADDAGVFQVSPDLCLVQTVDVFAPCVDDPYLFGQIAAANSLSDVYAMGGSPLTALSIVGWPISTVSDQWLVRMLEGGMDKLREAGVILVGGHSINDEEIKFGFAVTGAIRPNEIVANSGARPGDALILTKPIGTGILSFAAQIGRASAEALRAAGETMASLNRGAGEIMRRAGAHAATDVTGFGLLGHLWQVARESGVTVELWWDAVPALPEALECARQGIVSGAAERNREFAGPAVTARDVPEYAMDLLYDAQTSGGLLMCVPEQTAERTVAELRAAGCSSATIVGRVTEKSGGGIRVAKRPPQNAECGAQSAETGTQSKEHRASTPPARSVASLSFSSPAAQSGAQPAECCSAESAAAASAGAAPAAYEAFMGAAFAPGALDAAQKEIMTIALSVAVQCEPCLKIHLEKARSMGITPDEIREAAWMGIVFGGCKAMMFWKEKGPAS
jgi:selenide,water dikinase